MSKQVTRIMILGIVVHRAPISGYGIEKTLQEWATERWTSIAAASIYQQLRSLTVAGLIRPTGERTGRAVGYEPTAAGRDELHDLLRSLLHEQSPQPLSLIPLLHFTPTLSSAELIEGLTRRIAVIDRALSYESAVIEQAQSTGPSHVTEIFRLTWHGLRADRAWCREFLDRIAG